MGVIDRGYVILGIICILALSCESATVNVQSILISGRNLFKADGTINKATMKPYLSQIKGNSSSSNPADYEGLVKDVLDELGQLVPFNYTLNVRRDGMFGVEQENGTWSGLIGDLLYKNYDMVAAPFTVTSGRREVLDFSIPFQNFGPVIVMKKPKHLQPSLGDRLSKLFAPLDQSVWLLSFIAYLAVSTIVYIICHWNPYEWRRMAKDGEATIREAESFSCYNSFWFVLSAWVWQGYVRAPRSLGGRLVVLSWWVYVVLFLLTFTASLTNMLRMGPAPEEVRSFTRIRSLSDLTKQSGLDYGMLKGGATEDFFKNAKVPNLKRIYDIASQEPENLVNSIDDGIKRIRTSWRRDYALLMESAMAKFHSKQEPCDLYFVGDFTISGSYSFAYKKGFKLAKDLDIALLLLRENGILHLMEEKWFAGNCHGFMINPSQDDIVSLPPYFSVDLGSFSGALILLMIGVLIGSVITVAEVIIFKKVEVPQTEASERLRPVESVDNAVPAAVPAEAAPETDQTKV